LTSNCALGLLNEWWWKVGDASACVGLQSWNQLGCAESVPTPTHTSSFAVRAMMTVAFIAAPFGLIQANLSALTEA